MPEGLPFDGGGYVVSIPENPKWVVVKVYGGHRTSDYSYFKPAPNGSDPMLSSNNVVVIELNLADVRKNTKHQSEMDEEIFDENLKLIKEFHHILKNNPQSLSNDPKIQAKLEEISKLPDCLYGSSFGGLTVWEYARRFGGFKSYILKEPSF